MQTVTELEGAVLLEIGRAETCTAYRVRQQFRESPTLEWRASAGTIYPVVKRLVGRKWIKSTKQEADARSTESLSLTAKGRRALSQWVLDQCRGVSPGQDPFRLRAPYWLQLGTRERKKVFRGLEKSICERLQLLDEHAKSTDNDGRIRTELEIAMQKTRLDWLRRHRD